MRHLRRLVIAALFSIGIIGLLTLIPNVIGLSSATINVNNGGTYFPDAAATPSPTARFINCGAVPNTAATNWTLKRNTNFGSATEGIFQCTNNWNSDVNVTISLINDANATAVFSSFSALPTKLVPAGATVCFAPTSGTAFRSKTGSPTGTITYMVQATNMLLAGPKDLEAVFYFSHTVTVSNNGTPTYCTP